jgi:hypothetical protein
MQINGQFASGGGFLQAAEAGRGSINTGDSDGRFSRVEGFADQSNGGKR